MHYFNDHFLNKLMRYILVTFLGMLIMVWGYTHLDQLLIEAGTFLGWITGILMPLIFGIMLATLLSPLVHHLERGLKSLPILRKHRMRGLAVAVTVFWALFMLFLIASLLISSLTSNLQAINMENVQLLIDNFRESISGIWTTLVELLSRYNVDTSFLQDGIQYFSNWAKDSASNAARGLTGMMTTAFLALIFSIYFMADHERFTSYWARAVRAILPQREYDYFRELVINAQRAFIGYVRGQLLDALFIGVTMSIVLSLIGFPYALVIGVMTGIGNMIPYVGPAVAYLSLLTVGFVGQDYRQMVIALILTFVITTIDGNVINPRIISNAVSVHPVLVIAALLIGSAVGGIGGMFVAVPLASMGKIYFDKLIEWRKDESGNE